jgi:hypothetical protein
VDLTQPWLDESNNGFYEPETASTTRDVTEFKQQVPQRTPNADFKQNRPPPTPEHGDNNNSELGAATPFVDLTQPSLDEANNGYHEPETASTTNDETESKQRQPQSTPNAESRQQQLPIPEHDDNNNTSEFKLPAAASRSKVVAQPLLRPTVVPRAAAAAAASETAAARETGPSLPNGGGGPLPAAATKESHKRKRLEPLTTTPSAEASTHRASANNCESRRVKERRK